MGRAIKPGRAFDPEHGGESTFAARVDDPRLHDEADNPGLLGLTAAGSYNQTQVQAIIDKIDDLIESLETAGVLEEAS